nr:Ca2+-dependent phosphoinositide-specific phospholipase C [Pleionea sp. CnH1-48]
MELDVIDSGSWQSNSKGPYISHDYSPSGANCSYSGNDRLGHCFDDIRQWLNDNPNEPPLLILVDMKSGSNIFADYWNPNEIAALDSFISSYLGNKMYRYSDLTARLGSAYSGNYRERLKAIGWPLVQSLRGKVIVALTGGKLFDVNDRMESSLAVRGSNQATFLCPDMDADDPEEFSSTIDSISSTNSRKFFCGNVKAGDHYQLAANRAAEYKQIMHLWDRAGDFNNTDFAATWLAIGHGVQAHGWDIASPFHTPSWVSEVPLVGKRRSLPVYFKLKPTHAPSKCMDVSGSGSSNGTKIHQWGCHGGDNQRFVYTAEGQLRPKHHNKYCVDFSSGSAGNGKKMHLWDCDGGDSEKWAITLNGMFKSRSKNYSYCIDVPGWSTQNGTQWQLWGCGSAGKTNQEFILESVPDWNQTSF